MDDTLVRFLVIGGVALLAALAAVATRRWQRPVHPAVDVRGLGLPSGIVLFTSTECANCAAARRVAAATGAPIREVTWELEAPLLERAGVTSVPLTLVIDGDGAVVTQIVGIPPLRRLRRALGS